MSDKQSSEAVNYEVDFMELIRELWKSRWLVVLSGFFLGLLAALYAYLSKPVYEARVIVLPPSLSSVAGFNQGRTSDSGLQPFKVQDVYSVFIRNLQSDESLRRFFENIYLPSLTDAERSESREKLFRSFSKQISISLPDRAQPDRYLIVARQGNPELAAEWVKKYLADAADRSLQEMMANAYREIEVKARDVERRIYVLRETAKLRREDRITQLREALKVADSLGLERPPIINDQMSEQLSAIMSGNLMHMRGSKALKEEILVLEARTSDDPFIPALRTLQELESLYRGLSIKSEQVAVFRQDGVVEVPDFPVKPKKLLILFGGVMLGGMLGMLFVVIRLFYRRNAKLS
ncbi:Wzz/FepE/Etk N-terminal domain-containing protein [Pseudomonas aeruginosa]